MKTSIVDGTDYEEACIEAVTNEYNFANFKQDPRYTKVLEHPMYQSEGEAFLAEAYKQTPYLFTEENNALFCNDGLGNPTKFSYKIGNLSATTCRYIKVLSDLIYLNLLTDVKNIVEIGGGYGGQACVIDIYNKDLQNYKIVDLKSASALCNKYVKAMKKTHIKADTFENFSQDNIDLVISNFAFSECVKEVQINYIKDIINKATHGYITMNFINPNGLTISELLNLIEKNVVVIDTPKPDSTWVQTNILYF